MANGEREEIKPGEAGRLPVEAAGTDEPVEFADTERSEHFALVDRNGPSRGDGGSSGAPQWLGWFVVLAILLMMAVALILGAQRLREDQAVLVPTATPRPAIGSMRVGSPTVAADAVAEAGVPPTDTPTSAATGDTGAVNDTATISGTEVLSDTEALGETGVISAEQAVGEEQPATIEPGTPMPTNATTETDTATPLPTETPTEAASATATATTIPSETSTALPTETLTPSPTATSLPTATATTIPSETPTAPPTETLTPSPTATSLPTATTIPSETPTALPTETLTPSPTATTLPTATSVLTATPRPTATHRATATALPSGRFSAGASQAATPEPGMENVAPGDVLAGRAAALMLQTDASAGAPVMEVYGAGALFTVLEPAGEMGSYPVIAGGQEWVRVRAADGLVGWALLSALDRP